MTKFRQFIGFIRANLWSVPEGEISKFNRIVLGQIRVISLALKGSGNDKIFQKASALTYYTLWALVPVLALFFGVAKGFGFQDAIDRFLKNQFASQPEVADQLISLVSKYLDTIQGGFLVSVGIALLLWSVINVLSQIEIVFNDIWQNQKSRTFLRKFTDYFAFLILVPLIILISSGVNIFLLSHINVITEKIGLEAVITPLATLLAQTIPYILYIILFTLIYLIIPNTRVKFLSALIPGIIVGLMFQFLQMFYFNSQVYFGRIHTVYSSLAALPLLLLWIQIGWATILLGAEISFAYQNIKNFMYNDQLSKISKGYQRKLTLFIAYTCVKRFRDGDTPLTSEEIADTYNIPIRLVNQVLHNLSQAGILIEVATNNTKSNAYQPALDINHLSVLFITKRLDNFGSKDFVPIKTKEFEHLSKLIDSQTEELENSNTNILLTEL